jgi:hypothetical protein
MARRSFTKEEIDKLANKEWKKTPIFSSDEKVAYRARNLSGPKTPEGKARALQNLRVGKNKGEKIRMTHGAYIMKLLDEEEQYIYQELREAYEKDYDINSSADEVILGLVLFDQIRLYRVQKAQFANPSIDIDRPLSEIGGRLRANLEALGALRKQRLKQDERLTAISIATIAQQFHKQFMSGEIDGLVEDNQAEEEKFLANKKQREAMSVVDADYEIIEEDGEDEQIE